MTSISVIIPSYNHEAFVSEAIASVINQTFQVDEVIIVDDASTDRSVERIQLHTDSRIRLIALDINHGGAEALNIGIAAANGELIAICNSDDVWEPEKIERQLAFLNTNPEIAAVFCDVVWVGRHGQATVGFGDIFRQRNRTRHEWMRRLFEQGNCLCHPSVLIRKAVYDNVGRYDNRLRQLPDYHMWLRVLQRYEIGIIPDKLVRFRVHSNTSSPSVANSIRDRNEFADIALEFLQAIKADDFWRSFGTKIAPFDPGFDLAMEKILYLWSVSGSQLAISASWIANCLAMDLLYTDEGRGRWLSYGLTMGDFHSLRGVESPWLRRREFESFSAAEKLLLEKVGGWERIAKIAGSDSEQPITSSGSEVNPSQNVRAIRSFLRKLIVFARHPRSSHKRKLSRKHRLM